MHRLALTIRVAFAVLAVTCAAAPSFAGPETSQPRTVSRVTDATKTLSVKDGMVFYDRVLRPSRGIRFPAGTYLLEAEDASYWYLRSPVPLEIREFKSGEVVSSRTALGGIMLGKSFFKTIALPAAGYLDADGDGKVALWSLGGEFIRLEGSAWSKSF
jgi:hypothetical protein